jgi:putative hydrolase of the HAD superfamily
VDDSLPILRTARDFGIRHLLAMRRPDSKSPPRDIAEFPAINGFNEIMPATPVTTPKRSPDEA